MKPVRADFRVEGQQIYLRPITASDTDLVVGWRNQKDVVRNFIYRKPLTVQEHRSWLEQKVATGQVHQFIVCMREDDTPIGSVYLQKFEEENRKAESGIFIGNTKIRGKGIGTEAVKLLVKYGFDTLGLHKIVARVLSYNTASIRLHEKAGYVQEAYLRDELFLDGQYEDLIFFGIINPRQRREFDNEQNKFCNPLLQE